MRFLGILLGADVVSAVSAIRDICLVCVLVGPVDIGGGDVGI